MKKFLKNIFCKLRQRFAEDQSVEMPMASLRVVEPFVTRARRYKPDELSRFLNEHYQFRFNLLTEMTEFRSVQTPTAEFALLDDREMNTICIEAFNAGLCCRDRDVKRYVRSTYIEAYHPFRLYLESLPKWDGTDRMTDLARRVSSTSYWRDCFHRWMLALTAQWMGLNQGIHANSTAPLLVSAEQGWHKSTFCKSLVPAPLQAYYTDQLDLSEGHTTEMKLALMGLINLDEFDRLSVRKMAQLKNLMQMPALNLRKAYKKNYRLLPRIASFIGTSNRKDLLTDPTGSAVSSVWMWKAGSTVQISITTSFMPSFAMSCLPVNVTGLLPKRKPRYSATIWIFTESCPKKRSFAVIFGRHCPMKLVRCFPLPISSKYFENITGD